jgi:uncharacterized protein (DUF2267 family)
MRVCALGVDAELMSEQVSDRALNADEDRAMEQVLRNVRDRFPAAAADVVTANMHRAQERYADAPIRSFVPVLVERELMAEIRAAQSEEPEAQST